MSVASSRGRSAGSWMQRLARPWSRALAALDPRVFYIGLAAVLGVWVVVTNLLDREHHREASTYDWMLAHRVRTPVPDPDIALIDIDERSLAAMAGEYGRWPWPRDTLAVVLEALRVQGATAVVFDILFADRDSRNPVAERAFDDAIAASRIAYFPVLRLAPSSDAGSAVHASRLAGLVVPRVATPRDDPTLAVAMPYLDGAMRSGRLGTHNVDPDPDGLIRRYRMWEDVGDWRVLSLPARLAIDLGWPSPGAPQKTLRFNRGAMAYRTVSFVDFFEDALRKTKTRAADEFRGRIVVIGSTASGLYDQKGTPISRIHPGLDLLATAIDDTKNARFVDELSVPLDIAIALGLLAVMAWLCIRYSHEQLRLAFVIAPGLLFAVSYLSLNLSRVFVDLASPASIAFVYFSLAKLYSAQVRRRWSEGELFAPLLDPQRAYRVGCLAVALPPERQLPGFETRYLNLLRTRAPNVRLTSGLDAQGWLGSAFAGVLVATWVEPSDDATAIARARAEAQHLLQGLRGLTVRGPSLPTCFLDETVATDDPPIGGAKNTTGPVVPARLARLRALVSRTVLQMTEGTTA